MQRKSKEGNAGNILAQELKERPGHQPRRDTEDLVATWFFIFRVKPPASGGKPD